MAPLTEDGLALFLGALVYLLLLAFLFYLIRRRSRQSAKVHDRPVDEVVLRNALSEWLATERIQKALVTTRAVSAAELENTRTLLPSMSLAQLRSTASVLLRERMVRRIIAAWMWSRYRTDQAETLRELTEWAKPVPQRKAG